MFLAGETNGPQLPPGKSWRILPARPGDWKLLSLEINIPRKNLFLPPLDNGSLHLRDKTEKKKKWWQKRGPEKTAEVTLCSSEGPFISYFRESMENTLILIMALINVANLPTSLHTRTTEFTLKEWKLGLSQKLCVRRCDYKWSHESVWEEKDLSQAHNGNWMQKSQNCNPEYGNLWYKIVPPSATVFHSVLFPAIKASEISDWFKLNSNLDLC